MKKFKTLSAILIVLSICLFLPMTALPITASADTGPKPSVNVSFVNMGDTLCYGTLLSKSNSTGPYSAWDGNEENIYIQNDLDMEIWRAFAEYSDGDGYYFLQLCWKVSETKRIDWTYYPPTPFKILLYYPEINRFIVSDIYERYAFDTYFTVDMQGTEIGSIEYDESLSGDDRINNVFPSYDYTLEIFSLIARIIITVGSELLVALLFGFKRKGQILLIVAVNAVTQIILNVLLNVFCYNLGVVAGTVCYAMLEIAVVAIEAIVYCIFINKYGSVAKSKISIILYAISANLISFGIGLILANTIPLIF